MTKSSFFPKIPSFVRKSPSRQEDLPHTSSALKEQKASLGNKPKKLKLKRGTQGKALVFYTTKLKKRKESVKRKLQTIKDALKDFWNKNNAASQQRAEKQVQKEIDQTLILREWIDNAFESEGIFDRAVQALQKEDPNRALFSENAGFQEEHLDLLLDKAEVILQRQHMVELLKSTLSEYVELTADPSAPATQKAKAETMRWLEQHVERGDLLTQKQVLDYFILKENTFKKIESIKPKLQAVVVARLDLIEKRRIEERKNVHVLFNSLKTLRQMDVDQEENPEKKAFYEEKLKKSILFLEKENIPLLVEETKKYGEELFQRIQNQLRLDKPALADLFQSSLKDHKFPEIAVPQSPRTEQKQYTPVEQMIKFANSYGSKSATEFEKKVILDNMSLLLAQHFSRQDMAQKYIQQLIRHLLKKSTFEERYLVPYVLLEIFTALDTPKDQVEALKKLFEEKELLHNKTRVLTVSTLKKQFEAWAKDDLQLERKLEKAEDEEKEALLKKRQEGRKKIEASFAKFLGVEDLTEKAVTKTKKTRTSIYLLGKALEDLGEELDDRVSEIFNDPFETLKKNFSD